MPHSTPLRVLIAVAAAALGLLVAQVVVPDNPAWLFGRTLVPTILVLTLVMEWATERQIEGGLLGAALAPVRKMWGSSGAGLYSAIAAATFVRLEVETFLDEWAATGSLRAWLREELPEFLVGFSLDSIGNVIEASIWFVPWLSDFPTRDALVLGAACAAAFGLGRWAWPPAQVEPGEPAEQGV